MRRLIFLGAVSIDGYLARKDHSLELYDFAGFLEQIDILLMGRKTYEQLLVLSPDQWPYPGKTCYVFSRTRSGSNEYVSFVNEEIVGFTRRLNGRIWLMGGGEVLALLLGKGLPLFISGVPERRLRLVAVKQIGQLVELHYVRS